ncbi:MULTISPECIES: hypothetical protein [Rhodococcus]|uniref:Uncharacterized protein n=1 Tax=Rhodococcus oxybenzonivorans TaxID=1990687 RepID=A0AAE4UWY7_9NOCA|nr:MULTISPECIES: hypothetical protein [Rhodococcus]MDV7243627.1 hypothetical protein [Rhodococcus oxybenzonivorans]MDV7264310.1 hypothetical protein [Rhodococcus oxybenzonivorans]MDV7275131.1 hypothetical protein [Rhodococcus oxybenzonivorans]MDV7335369.1 hypothetical protein [Rhodococcus oxybenzonivorans]MDV7346080.1 hypothetical protein [Rhodococcus oxybenzonivorans]
MLFYAFQGTLGEGRPAGGINQRDGHCGLIVATAPLLVWGLVVVPTSI